MPGLRQVQSTRRRSRAGPRPTKLNTALKDPDLRAVQTHTATVTLDASERVVGARFGVGVGALAGSGASAAGRLCRSAAVGGRVASAVSQPAVCCRCSRRVCSDCLSQRSSWPKAAVRARTRMMSARDEVDGGLKESPRAGQSAAAQFGALTSEIGTLRGVSQHRRPVSRRSKGPLVAIAHHRLQLIWQCRVA